MSIVNTSLKIVQWNARSLNSNKFSLTQLNVEDNFDIALISETWYKPADVKRFQNFNIITKDRNKGHGGVAICISNLIKYEIIEFVNNFHPKIEVGGINILVMMKN